MRSTYRQSGRVAVWSLLAILLILAGVAYVEELLPELETQTQDEQALAELSYALKTGRTAIESSPARDFSLIITDHLSSALLRPEMLRHTRGSTVVKPPSVDLYQRFSTYRI